MHLCKEEFNRFVKMITKMITFVKMPVPGRKIYYIIRSIILLLKQFSIANQKKKLKISKLSSGMN